MLVTDHAQYRSAYRHNTGADPGFEKGGGGGGGFNVVPKSDTGGATHNYL